MAYVDFPRSDGSPSNWPVNDPKCFKEPLDSSSTKAWWEFLGQKVAEQLNLPHHKKINYILKDFPEGYRLFRRPRSTARHIGDLHLYGLEYHKGLATAFRSPQRFLPHALWLLSDEKSNCYCQCDYCLRAQKAGKPKRNGKRREPPLQKVDISAQNTAILHAFLGKLDIRIQEVVWVHLREAISLSTGESDSETRSVNFWPAVVSSVDCDDSIASVTFLGMSKTQAVSSSRLLPYHAYKTPTVITSKLPSNASIESLGSSTSDSYSKALRHCREIEKTFCISSDSSELKVWIGPELVCAGDFVFLKVSRNNLPISRAISAPSGPGSLMQELLSKSLSNPAVSGGVGSLDPDRGVLLGVTYFDEVNTGSSTGVKLKGILYEFADDDWIENTDQSPSLNADISNWKNSQLKIVKSKSGEIEAPVPPAGLQLRQILSPGYQALVTLQCVKSRYYPCITSHPLLCDAKSRPLRYGGLEQELRQIPSRKDVIDRATY